jgi:hypothetical protein
MSKAQGEPYAKPSKERVKAADQQLLEQQRVIEYDTKEFTIEVLKQKFGDGGADADIYIPDYQRRFSWDFRRRSRFIESVLMGLPIPFLFFGDKRDGRLELVDGSQRLRTCVDFLDDELTLVDCERLALLDGFRFSDLPLPQQRRFKNRTIRAVVLSQNATEDDLRDLFDRINTGSLIAKPAEVRRGSRRGVVTDLIDELAADATFRELCPMSEQAERLRLREELVTRFLTFSDKFEAELPGYRDRVTEYLDDWVEEQNKRAKTAKTVVPALRSRFTAVMGFVKQHFPHGFTKTPQSKFTPNVRFDAIAVGVSEALREKPRLKPVVAPATWLQSDEFFDLTTSNAANVRSKIVDRIAFVRDKLLGAVHGRR